MDPGLNSLLQSTRIDFSDEDIAKIKAAVAAATDDKTIAAAAAILNASAYRFIDFTKGAMGLPQALVEAARVVPIAARRSLLNQRLAAATDAARQALQKNGASEEDCTNVLIAAGQAQQYLAFESWLSACSGKFANKSPSFPLADLPISKGLAYLY